MPQLEAANKKSNWFVVRIIDIGNNAPVAHQYNFRGIPYGILFSPDKKKLEASNVICWVAAEDPEKIREKYNQ